MEDDELKFVFINIVKVKTVKKIEFSYIEKMK